MKPLAITMVLVFGLSSVAFGLGGSDVIGQVSAQEFPPLEDDTNCNEGLPSDQGSEDDIQIGTGNPTLDRCVEGAGDVLDNLCPATELEASPHCSFEDGNDGFDMGVVGNVLSTACDTELQDVTDGLDDTIGPIQGYNCGPEDTTDPSAPGTLSVTGEDHESVDLSWGVATDDVGVAHYTVYYSTQPAVAANVTALSSDTADASTTHSIDGLSAETTYYFIVTASDAAGNEGLPSNEVSTTTDEAPAEPPAPPCHPNSPACVPLDGSGAAVAAISTVFDEIFGDGAPLFPDDGADGEGTDGCGGDDIQLTIPGGTAILGFQDSDCDGDTDFEELTGCGGTGVPINPLNPAANCGNYDGDGIPNEDDPNPYIPDTLLILEVVTSTGVAPIFGDQIHFKYQCYEGIGDLNLVITQADMNGGSSGLGNPNYAPTTTTPTAIFSPDLSNPAYDPAKSVGDCHNRGNITFTSDLELNVTNTAKSNHLPAGYDFRLWNSTAGVASNSGRVVASNAAETGTWTPTCILNLTSNGYCGTPGEWHILNGVNVTYDANRFPSVHPNPNFDVEYTLNWTFVHTSYKAGDGHNLTRISIENQYTDANCGSGTDNQLTFNELSGDCGRAAERRDDYLFTEPTGFDDDGVPYYNMTTTYEPRAVGTGLPSPSQTNQITAQNQYLVAEVVDRGGTRTYWGEKTQSCSNFGLGSCTDFDDHGKFTHFMASYSRFNQLPQFDYVDAPGGFSLAQSVSHNNETAPYVIHDREAGIVKLSVILHDDRGFADVGSPSDDLNVTIRYAIANNTTHVPTPDEFVTVHELPKVGQVCSSIAPLPVDPTRAVFRLITCEFEGDGDTGLPLLGDQVDDRVDGDTQDSEAFRHIIEVDAGKVIHYNFSVTDTEYPVLAGNQDPNAGNQTIHQGIMFTYVVGELPLDAESISSLAGSGIDSDVQDIVDALAVTIDPFKVLTDPNCNLLDIIDEEDIPEGCSGGAPGDFGDPWDTDEDGNVNEPNNQVDILERFVYYVDTDVVSSGRSPAHFDEFDGYNNADGASLHINPSSNGFQGWEHPVARVGDIDGTDQLELVLLTDGFEFLCIVEHPLPVGQPGQADISVYAGSGFDKDADSPCGDELTAPLTLKAVTIGSNNPGYVGVIVYNDEDNDDERDGAEGRRHNLLAGSCEDVLIVAINTINPADSIIRLLPAEPYEKDPCSIPSGVDSDGDGVDDAFDQCADTDPDVNVTDAGCPDDDQDGVLDDAPDECPDTPEGTSVNEAGCPDADGDGVADEDDACDDTPDGAIIGDDGCDVAKPLTDAIATVVQQVGVVVATLEDTVENGEACIRNSPAPGQNIGICRTNGNDGTVTGPLGLRGFKIWVGPASTSTI